MTNDERDLNQAWDEFLGLDPDGRETFAAASDDEATIRELHLRYRPPVPSVEFRERLIQSIPKVLPRTASETIPASSVPAATVPASTNRRYGWRSAPVWGYATMVLIIGLIAIAAGYTYMQTNDGADPTESDRAMTDGSPAAIEETRNGNVTTVSNEVVLPADGANQTVSFYLVTLPAGATYSSDAAGTELAFTSEEAVSFQAADADKQTAISPFVVSNPGDALATFVLISTGGDKPSTDALNAGATVVPLTAEPIQVPYTGEAIVEVVFGSGSAMVETTTVSGTTYLTSETGAVGFSSGGSDVVTGATAEVVDIPASSIVELPQGSPTFVEPLTDGPWIMITVAPVTELQSAVPANATAVATPVFATPATIP